MFIGWWRLSLFPCWLKNYYNLIKRRTRTLVQISLSHSHSFHLPTSPSPRQILPSCKSYLPRKKNTSSRTTSKPPPFRFLDTSTTWCQLPLSQSYRINLEDKFSHTIKSLKLYLSPEVFWISSQTCTSHHAFPSQKIESRYLWTCLQQTKLSPRFLWQTSIWILANTWLQI